MRMLYTDTYNIYIYIYIYIYASVYIYTYTPYGVTFIAYCLDNPSKYIGQTAVKLWRIQRTIEPPGSNLLKAFGGWAQVN